MEPLVLERTCQYPMAKLFFSSFNTVLGCYKALKKDLLVNFRYCKDQKIVLRLKGFVILNLYQLLK